MSGKCPAPQEQVSHNSALKSMVATDRHAYRFSSGLTLQAKVDLSPQTEDPTVVSTSSSRRQSSRRSVGSGDRRYSSLTEEPIEGR